MAATGIEVVEREVAVEVVDAFACEVVVVTGEPDAGALVWCTSPRRQVETETEDAG